MRILVAHTQYRHAGGEAAVVATESALLREAGVEVVLHEAQNPDGGAATAAALAQALWNPGAAKALRTRIGEVRPDVVHLHNWWFAMSPSVVRAVRQSGVPLVATAHNYRLSCLNATHTRHGEMCTLCLGGSTWPGVKYQCYAGSTGRSAALASTLQLHRRLGTWDGVDRWLALSASQAEVLVQAGLPADRITVKPNAAPDPGPRTSPPSRGSDVLCAGRLVPERGVDVLLQAWRAAAPTSRLVVLGEGPERERLEAMAPDGVTFLGYVQPDEVQRRLATARALVFPTQLLEPFGMSLLEAMAAGLPAIGSDLGAVKDVLGEGGWAVPGDVAGWTAGLAHLDDGDALDRRGAAGRARYLSAFEPSQVTAQLIGVYEDLRRS